MQQSATAAPPKEYRPKATRVSLRFFLCNLLVVTSAVLWVLISVLTSMLYALNDQRNLISMAGSYAVVRQQQQVTQRQTNALTAPYGFAIDMNTVVSAAVLAEFNQKTIVYWLSILHGATDAHVPARDTAALRKTLQAYPELIAAGGAEEGAAKAKEISQKMSVFLQNSALPLKRFPLTLALMLVSAQGYLAKAFFADLFAVFVAVLLGTATYRILNRVSRFFYWFSGLAMLLGLAGCAIVFWQLQDWMFFTVIQRFSEVLAIYLQTLARMVSNTLFLFMAVYLLGGTVLMVMYCQRRYHHLHRTHHELSRF